MQESMRVISGGNTGNAARLWHTPLRTRAAVRPALRQGAALAVGLAGGWAVLYGALLPFGPGLALGLGEDCFAASAAGAALGLLLHGFGALSLQSICLLCGLGAIVAGRWLWPGRFLPAAAAGGAALACSAFCLSLGAEGGGVELLLFCGADALLAGAIGFGLRRFPPEKPGAGTLLPAMACAAALGSLALGPLVLGVAACAAAEYLLCCQERAGLRWPSVRPQGRRSALWTRNLPRRLPGSPAPRGRQPCWPRAGGWKRWPPTRAAA